MSELGERFIFRGRPMTLRVLVRMVHRLYAQHGDLVVTVSDAKEVRSLDQNRFMWAMCAQIGAHLGADKNATHDYLLDTCYGEKFKVVNGKPIQVRPKTRAFTKQQMVKFLDWSLQWAAENAGPVMMPKDYQQWAIEARNG